MILELNQKNKMGLIAQELNWIITEVVDVNYIDNVKCMSYGLFVGLLVKSIKNIKTNKYI